MKILSPAFLMAVIVIVECSHTFIGTSVQRELVQTSTAKYGSRILRKRVEDYFYSVPYRVKSQHNNRTVNIQGILAYDMTNSTASANVTSGGIGYSYVNLRMKSEQGEALHYNIHIYV